MLTEKPSCVFYKSQAPTDTYVGQYIRLSRRDIEAFENFAPVTVGYLFKDFIEPSDLCQSLAVMLSKLPGFTGQIVTLDTSGTYYIKPSVHPPCICAIVVPGEAVAEIESWGKIMEWYPLRPNNVAGTRLFQALLVHSVNPADGCALLVSIDHVLADATTVSYFLYDWSQQHFAMFGRIKRLPDMSLPKDTEVAHGDVTVRRFYFTPQTFSHVKGVINGSSPPDCQVTVNDILVAMCGCAVASKAEKVGQYARIAMMVDPRGRGVTPNFMGNASMPMNIFVEWSILSSQDLAAICLAVRKSVQKGLEALKDTCKLDPSNEVTDEALMQWNSWARARGLVDATFGNTLKKFEWVNLRMLKEGNVFIVVPVTSNGGLALQVALPHAVMEYLVQIWETFAAPRTSA